MSRLLLLFCFIASPSWCDSTDGTVTVGWIITDITLKQTADAFDAPNISKSQITHYQSDAPEHRLLAKIYETLHECQKALRKLSSLRIGSQEVKVGNGQSQFYRFKKTDKHLFQTVEMCLEIKDQR
jgi:hypothetical protein